MILRDGKFYNDHGQVVPLEFGNKEQIALIHDYERREREFNKGMIMVFDVDESESIVKLHSHFRCLCEKYINFDSQGDSEYIAYDMLDGQRQRCTCGRKYVLELADQGFYIVKFAK